MDKVLIGYDDNLGLPKGFSETLGCDVAPYHILTPMLEDFAEGKLSAIFIPSGTLPYVKEYKILSQALLGPESKINLQTNFVTGEPISIEDLPNITIGRVNKYCTTSFWAPLIYLKDFLPKNTIFKFQDTNGFKDMLVKTAEKKIVSSMVWDIFLIQNPNLANKVHQLFTKDDLPCPVLCAKENFPQNLIEKINQFKSNDSQAFFNGFQTPNIPFIQSFLEDIKKASAHFAIEIR